MNNGIAEKYIGCPFVDGGRDPKTGLDCYGLVRVVCKDIGYDLPDYEYDNKTESVFIEHFHEHVSPVSRKDVQFGDLVVFNAVLGSSVHIGFMLDSNRFLHCTRPMGVITTKLTAQPFCRKIKGFYRFNGTKRQ